MVVILLPLAVALLGLLVYLGAMPGPTRPKLVEVGRILFAMGILATLLHLSAKLLALP